ncbi:MAG: TusE/DsrC/DsvC family sulfur relay protein [Chromatiaceae bacterium]|nr:TusE/DsrC/DsvC family sulfur relay protein [Chromatiaceae bacterium]MCP5408005.1 TusE/DsrC/DsvC family sulfur relay protein [Chromatiaceae bacterium]MCP5442904.1 TusE/DsrC/DsvC family sulfur relay protein [Chromatiaceae bacterium]
MYNIQVDGRDIQLNDEGYLVNFEDWDRSVAETLAAVDKLTLTECHWVAIDFMRDFYRQYEIPPSSRALLKAVGNKIYENGCSRRDLEKMFPKGGCDHACRLAGLPEAYCHAC